MKTLITLFVCLFASLGISGMSFAQPAFTVSSIGNGYIDGLVDFHSFNSSTYITVGTQGSIFKTSNSGALFSKIDCSTTVSLNCINFVNANTGYIGGGNGSVLKSTDAGSSWNTLVVGLTPRTIYGITIKNSEINLSGGLGTIFKSTNNGNNWIDQSFSLSGSFLGGTAYVSGGKKLQVASASPLAVWTTTNGGLNWIGESLPNNAQALGQYWQDSLVGYVIGCLPSSTTQVVYKTTNGGLNWNTITLSGSAYVKDISFCNANTGFIVAGTNSPSKLGQIYWTTNAGASWTMIKEYTGTELYSVACFGTKVYVGADPGKVLSADISVSINPISTVVPDKYSLSQNFPNPFNPSTTIRFTIPKATEGSLVIYNMQGQEIAVIANQHFTAGTYEPHFNASGLSSGTYFYRLKTEGFSQTKKMMLVK